MPAIHRHGDARVCGATTIVSGQSTVRANGELVSVDGDHYGSRSFVFSKTQEFKFTNQRLALGLFDCCCWEQ